MPNYFDEIKRLWHAPVHIVHKGHADEVTFSFEGTPVAGGQSFDCVISERDLDREEQNDGMTTREVRRVTIQVSSNELPFVRTGTEVTFANWENNDWCVEAVRHRTSTFMHLDLVSYGAVNVEVEGYRGD